MTKKEMQKIKIFVSYSHQNEDWVAAAGKYKLIPWLERQLEGQAEIWTDHALKRLIGEEYTQMITKKILEADMVIMMISQDFVSSQYIMEIELPLIRQQYKNDNLKIIPMLITELTKKGKEKIKWIFDLQTYPNDTKPLVDSAKSDSEWTRAKVEILDGIETKIDEINFRAKHFGSLGSSRKDEKLETIVNSPELVIGKKQLQIGEEYKICPNETCRRSCFTTDALFCPYCGTAIDVQIGITIIDNNPKARIGFDSFAEELNCISFEMVAVEGGTFLMGSNDGADNERPVHEVTLSNFFIGKTAVTQEMWQMIMGSNPSHFKGKYLPVEMVSWYDCQLFIQKLNYVTLKNCRLPTKAEWEYAARGGRESKGCIFSGGNVIDEVAWYGDGTKENQTHTVGTKRPNELGIYDMSGNVWEWCNDWVERYSINAEKDPVGPSNGMFRVLRGGSWYSKDSDCRATCHKSKFPSYRGRGLGFRLALTP